MRSSSSPAGLHPAWRRSPACPHHPLLVRQGPVSPFSGRTLRENISPVSLIIYSHTKVEGHSNLHLFTCSPSCKAMVKTSLKTRDDHWGNKADERRQRHRNDGSCEVKGWSSHLGQEKDAESGINQINLDIKNKINFEGQMRPPTAADGQNNFPTLPKEWETLIARDTLVKDGGNSRNER